MTSITCIHGLRWPRGYKRADYAKPAKFRTGTRGQVSINEAIDRLEKAVNAFTPRFQFRSRTCDAVLTTQLVVAQHGRFKGNQPEPQDQGVAFYFELDRKPIVLCCDKWSRIADNIAAIAATLDAMRDLERWGVAEAVDRVFTGFAALPAPGEVQARTCWHVLGIPRTTDTAAINRAYFARAKIVHPDAGDTGSTAAMAELNDARDQALRDAEAK